MASDASKADEPCMYGHSGGQLAQWLPEMQSREFLRQSIARGERTDECWAEMSQRAERVRAGMAVIARMKERAKGGQHG